MKFCIYWAGAIGGYLAVELALSGQEVCVVARGAHLEAIRERGLTLKIHGKEKVANVAADSQPGAYSNVIEQLQHSNKQNHSNRVCVRCRREHEE